MRQIAIVIGTRPEAIKMAPVIYALRRHPDEFKIVIIATAQHREMLDQALSVFKIQPDFDLELMRPQQGLPELTSRILLEMTRRLSDLRPDMVMVQGDTTSAFATALAAFQMRIPVAHLEAGLRTYRMYDPYPEEINRRLITSLAEIHLAPTSTARSQLLAEGVLPEQIAVTGNTAVDALMMLNNGQDLSLLVHGNGNGHSSYCHSLPGCNGHRVLLVTCHRRESWGEDLENICVAIDELVQRFPDIFVVFPLHKNPVVHDAVQRLLGGHERVCLTEPLEYLSFIEVMRRSHLVLTDSGGVQEEAPTLHKPVVVLRRVTERSENCELGQAELVGTDRHTIVARVSEVLSNPAVYRRMATGRNPFGDGRASERVLEVLRRWSCGVRPLLQPDREFHAADPYTYSHSAD